MQNFYFILKRRKGFSWTTPTSRILYSALQCVPSFDLLPGFIEFYIRWQFDCASAAFEGSVAFVQSIFIEGSPPADRFMVWAISISLSLLTMSNTNALQRASNINTNFFVELFPCSLKENWPFITHSSSNYSINTPHSINIDSIKDAVNGNDYSGIILYMYVMRIDSKFCVWQDIANW